MRSFIALMAITATVGAATGQTLDTSNFERWCREEPTAAAAFIAGALTQRRQDEAGFAVVAKLIPKTGEALLTANLVLASMRKWCVPDDIDLVKVTVTVCKQLSMFPFDYPDTALEAAQKVVNDEWPCPEN